MRCIDPPGYRTIPFGEPLVFLAGPIQGAPDWQNQAVDILAEGYSGERLHIASPRRNTSVNKEDYEPQVSWELSHLSQAARFGAVLFWFAAQDPEIPYEAGRAYAQTTRIELGEAFGKIDVEDVIDIAIGFDPDYRGGSERYIRFRASMLDVEVFDSLEGTCQHILDKLEKRISKPRG